MGKGQKLFTVMLMYAMSLFSVNVLADLLVVVNPKLKIQSLTKQQVSDIFLDKTNELPTGEPITPYLQSVKSEIHEQFNIKVHERSTSQLKAYWARLVFTGKGSPPAYFEDVNEVKRKIKDNPEIISYIYSEELDDTVKVVARYP